MQLNVEKGVIGAAVLGLLFFWRQWPSGQGVRQLRQERRNEIVNLTGVEFLDEDGKAGFIERPVRSLV